MLDLNAVLLSIEKLIRQRELKAVGPFQYTPSDMEMSEPEIVACIAEELGEVARNVLARKGLVRDGNLTNGALYRELTQIAALSVAWMQRLHCTDGYSR